MNKLPNAYLNMTEKHNQLWLNIKQPNGKYRCYSFPGGFGEFAEIPETALLDDKRGHYFVNLEEVLLQLFKELHSEV